ncbi:HAD family hydrolase [Agrococcus jejuensis]|uniref:Haloacid dehalogenase superfamily, subfamily IA, variant 3 with third motif having DD or ED n=1 Tax=Agrococcus jejuensis TaxID=399736 RepID=A0A1G8H6I5_9MICO|nr:HAD family phosphatase [Agrococcus jejuensis]SDI02294.1 haloacid dehalogenase superfamily, subfamily IA, variant 3 with third motif having DD or ED [Agrococcus jejuensis]
MSDLDAVLWDLDGTLIDSESYWRVAERRLVAEFDVEWTLDDEAALVGVDLWDGARYMVGRGVAMEPDDIVARLDREVMDQLREHVPFRPGAAELLTSLKAAQVPLALVTMSTRALVELVLASSEAQLGVQPFTVSVTGDEVPRGKPHPDPYLQALEALGARAASSVAFEDSIPGSTSARDAGLVTVGIPHEADLGDVAGITLWPTLVDRTVDDVRGLVGVRA